MPCTRESRLFFSNCTQTFLFFLQATHRWWMSQADCTQLWHVCICFVKHLVRRASSESHSCWKVEGGRRHRGVFSGSHGRLRSTRSRGRPPERAGNRHHAPTVLMESPSSTIHYISSSFLPRSTLLSTTFKAGL